MKTQTTVLGIIFFLATFAFASPSQAFDPPTVKLLPISKDGMLRIMVTDTDNKTVRVNFYEENKLITSDRIYGKEYKKGFFKSYDLNLLKTGVYKIEVVNGGNHLKYEIEMTADKKVWARYWDQFLESERVIALR